VAWQAVEAEIAREMREYSEGIGMEELLWREWKKHCDVARRGQHVWVHYRPCVGCGVSFRPKHRDGRYCGGVCRKRAERRAARAEPRPVKPAPQVRPERACQQCGAIFRRNAGTNFCSTPCKDRARWLARKAVTFSPSPT
jgi:hypothetical protein